MAGEVIGVQGVRITDLPEVEAAQDSNYMILVDEVTGRTYKVKREHIKAQKTSELVDDVGYMTESEVKEFTNAEIAQIREVLNTWTSFKNNGGKINGDIEIEKHLANLKIGDSFNIKTYDHATELSSDWNKAIVLRIRSNATDTASYVRLNGVNFAGNGNMSLGEEGTPWNDIYLKGVSKSDNGYTKLPNGLIMQWGILNMDINLSDSFSFDVILPMAFPTTTLYCSGNVKYNFTKDNDHYIEHVNVNIQTLGSDRLRIKGRNVGALDMPSRFQVHWFAIGY